MSSPLISSTASAPTGRSVPANALREKDGSAEGDWEASGMGACFKLILGLILKLDLADL